MAPSPRIASVTRNPSRPGSPITAVGWNCSSSRSASRAPAAWASISPTPWEPGGLVVRSHSAAAPPVAIIVAPAAIRPPSSQTTPRQRPSRHHSAALALLEHVHVRILGRQRRQLAHEPAAGRAAAGMDDPAHRVASLQAERELAEAVGVEMHPEPLEVAHPCGRLVDEDLGGRAPHQPATRPLGVGQVQLEAVVRRQHRRQPSLRPVARGACQRGGGYEHDPGSLSRRAERRVQAGGTRADDGHLGLQEPGRGPAHRPKPYPSRSAGRRMVVPVAPLGARAAGARWCPCRLRVSRSSRPRAWWSAGVVAPGVVLPGVVAPGVVVPGVVAPGVVARASWSPAWWCPAWWCCRRGGRRDDGCGGGRRGAGAVGELHERGGEDPEEQRGDHDRGRQRGLPVRGRRQAGVGRRAAVQAPVLVRLQRRAAQRACLRGRRYDGPRAHRRALGSRRRGGGRGGLCGPAHCRLAGGRTIAVASSSSCPPAGAGWRRRRSPAWPPPACLAAGVPRPARRAGDAAGGVARRARRVPAGVAPGARRRARRGAGRRRRHGAPSVRWNALGAGGPAGRRCGPAGWLRCEGPRAGPRGGAAAARSWGRSGPRWSGSPRSAHRP